MRDNGQNKKSTIDKTGIAALITAIAVIIVAICFLIIKVYNTRAKEYEYVHMYDNVPDGYVMFHDGFVYKIDEYLETRIYDILDSEYIDENEKRELLVALSRQGISVEIFEAHLDKDSKIESDSTNYYTEFLKSAGLIKEDSEISKTESGMTLVNSKPAKSYRTLADAENAFGLNLGLYFYCDSLENYEMVNAFTVDDSFLYCVYAVNQDGTALKDNQDVESTEIKTISIKLSTSIKSKELMSVYKDYTLLISKELDNTDVNYCGYDNKVNMIYCDRDEDNRSYVIHSAEGISKETAENLVHELFSNLRHYKNGVNQ